MHNDNFHYLYEGKFMVSLKQARDECTASQIVILYNFKTGASFISTSFVKIPCRYVLCIPRYYELKFKLFIDSNTV